MHQIVAVDVNPRRLHRNVWLERDDLQRIKRAVVNNAHIQSAFALPETLRRLEDHLHRGYSVEFLLEAAGSEFWRNGMKGFNRA
jgi:hypothetical protein